MKRRTVLLVAACGVALGVIGFFALSSGSQSPKAAVAVRLYESEKGKPPATLAELVPGWLPAVPRDPFSKSALVYRPSSNSFALYSVGPDGKDDGGVPIGRGNVKKGDLVPGSF